MSAPVTCGVRSMVNAVAAIPPQAVQAAPGAIRPVMNEEQGHG
jgi:hypothetical protein